MVETGVLGLIDVLMTTMAMMMMKMVMRRYEGK